MLEQIYLFEGLTEESREAIERCAVIKTYPKNSVIIEQNDDASSLFILLSGEVKVYSTNENGRDFTLCQQGPGTVLGELALLAGIPRTASVKTLMHCEVAVLSKQSFHQCLNSYPEIALNLVRTLALKVQSLTESVTDFALLDVYGRITRLLNEVAQWEDGRLITPKLTHQSIAERVGASREMVSKIFKDLRAGGYLVVDGKRYILQRKLPIRW